MAAKLTRLTHKIAIQLHLVAESCTICSFRSRQPVSPKTFGYTLVLWTEGANMMSSLPTQQKRGQILVSGQAIARFHLILYILGN
jgi:hypothetical protein